MREHAAMSEHAAMCAHAAMREHVAMHEHAEMHEHARINNLTHSHLVVLIYSIEDGSVRLWYSRNPTQCVNVLVLRLVAGLLRPRPSFKQVEQSSK
jgi:hypothetical protein